MQAVSSGGTDERVPEGNFESLMGQHAPAVRASIRAVLGRSADEEDLVQEVFTRLLIRLRQGGSVDAGPWCRRAARNLAIDHVRRRAATPTEDREMERPWGDGLDKEVLGREATAQLATSLWRLPEQHRRVLLAQFGTGDHRESRSHAEIGAELGLSAKATESLLARARRRLRRELEAAGFETHDGRGPAAPEPTAATGRPSSGLATRAKVVVAGAAVAVSAATAIIATAPLLTSPAAALTGQHAPEAGAAPAPGATRPCGRVPLPTLLTTGGPSPKPMSQICN